MKKKKNPVLLLHTLYAQKNSRTGFP